MNARESSPLAVVRKAWGHAAIYAVGSLFLGVGQIAIAPLLIGRLSLAEFGTYELFLAIYVAGRSVLLLPLASATLYGYCRLSQSDEERRRIVATGMQLAACCSAGLCLVGLMLPEWPDWLLRTGPDANAVGRAVVFGLCLESIVQIGLSVLRASQRPAAYGVIALVQLVSTLSLVWLFVGVVHRGVQGVFEAFFLGNAPAVLALVPVLRGSTTLAFDRKRARSLTLFALTVVPVNLALLVIAVSDRYFLRYFWDLPTVGVYALSYKLGSAAPQMIAMPFLMAWPAFVFADTGARRTGQLVSSAALYLWAVGLLLVVMVSSASRPLVLLFGGATFLAGAPLIPIVSVGVLLGGVMNVVASAVVAAGRVVWNMAALLVVSAVLLGLNAWLIPPYGMFGAAMATLVGYALGAAAAAILARRVVVLDIEGFKWAKVSLAALGAFLAGRGLDQVSPSPFVSLCAAAAVSGGVYTVLLAVSGVIPKEWRRLAGWRPWGTDPVLSESGLDRGRPVGLVRPGEPGPAGLGDARKRPRACECQVVTHEPGMPVCGVEMPSYLDRGGLQTYMVEHRPAPPWRAVVVLAGPMSLERSCGYLTWVRWARTLACNGYVVLRFDYSGVGESTGAFAEQTFDTWADDLRAVTAFARQQYPGMRLFVNGLRLGALLGQRVEDADGLLAWDPPSDGRRMLSDMLRRKLASDYVERVSTRGTYDGFIRALEDGALLEVEGYPWSPRLWSSASRHVFGPHGRYHAVYFDGRPPQRLADGVHAEVMTIGNPPFWLQPRGLIADVGELFERSLARLGEWS